MELNIYNNPDFPLEIKEEHIINFDYGLPGFEDLKKFTIVDISCFEGYRWWKKSHCKYQSTYSNQFSQ